MFLELPLSNQIAGRNYKIPTLEQPMTAGASYANNLYKNTRECQRLRTLLAVDGLHRRGNPWRGLLPIYEGLNRSQTVAVLRCK
jgi:hypothetical protein